VGSNNCFVDGMYWIKIYNNNLRFLNNMPYNANVVDFVDLKRSTSSSGATYFLANSTFACPSLTLGVAK